MIIKKFIKLFYSINRRIMENNYWIGPYNVRVPTSVDRVVASDGYNTCLRTGGETEMYMFDAPEMNAEIYHRKYAELRNDGHYYYRC